MPSENVEQWAYYYVPRDYGLPTSLEQRVFVAILLRRAGRDITEGELTVQAITLVAGLAEWVVSDWLPSLDVKSNEQRALTRFVNTLEPAEAFAAFRGLRPDLRGTPGGYAAYKAVSRAALAREVRPIVGALRRLRGGGSPAVSIDDPELG